MTRLGDDMSVNGSVWCTSPERKPLSDECEPGAVHRLDHDLELCVCEHCGQGWIRDVSAWARLNESIERLTNSMMRIDALNQSMIDSLSKLNKALNKP